MSDAGEPRLRLRGAVGGAERSYAIGVGETSVGSVAENDIVLPVRGVSRRHALVRLSQGGELSVEDRESRNGVIVNGARVERAALRAGDQVGLGPVTLRVEAIPAGDGELGIALGGAPRAGPGLPAWETTTAAAAADDGGAWLPIVEAMLGRLAIVPEGDVPGALQILVRELGARGACVLERKSEETLVLAAAGEIGDLSGRESLDRLWPAGKTDESGVLTAVSESEAASAVLAGRDRAPVALVVFGPFRGQARAAPLLRFAVRLVDRLRPQLLHAPASRPARGPRGLIFPEGYLPGDSPAMVSLYGQMQPLVQGDIPVLIEGETGSGKEYLARTLHASSRRARGPFVAVNCAAIPADLLEAEMFGIGKGVATGVTERPGKFQLAAGGTLLLDEIGDTPLPLQAKLLRALQEKEVQPVGSAPVAVDLRVVAATNSDLLKRVEEGRFRADLYYRVAGYVLRVPPLRERREDIPVLVEGFLRAFSRETKKGVRGLTVAALRALVELPWPGNVRELEHEVRRLVYLCPDGEAIDSRMLSAHAAATAPDLAAAAAAVTPLDLEVQVEKLEGQLIRAALARAGGNRSQAAKLLGISRNGLAIKMERLGISA